MPIGFVSIVKGQVKGWGRVAWLRCIALPGCGVAEVRREKDGVGGGERSVTGGTQGMFDSRRGSKQRAEGFGFGFGLGSGVGIVGVVEGGGDGEEGGGETVLVLVLVTVVVLDLVVEGRRGRGDDVVASLLVLVDEMARVDVAVVPVTWTVVPEVPDVADGGEGSMTEYRPEPSATSVMVMVCVAVVSEKLPIVVALVVDG